MFYANIAFQWAGLADRADGVCVSAWGVNAVSALTRDGRNELPDPRNRLFDPQLYLRQLNYSDCETAVNRLATYRWFNPDVPQFDGSLSVADWQEMIAGNLQGQWPFPIPSSDEEIREAVQSSLEFQVEFGVGALIVPSPLTSDPMSDYSEELRWLDAAIELRNEFGKLPVLATIALSDQALLHSDPPDNALLSSIADQVTAREIDGTYIVIEQAVPPPSTAIQNRRVAWALLSLCHDVGVKAGKFVFINYADIFGLACIGAGATGFASATSIRSRRLVFDDYEVRGGGGPFPRFYSYDLLIELLPERDIEAKLLPNRLLRMIERDRTDASDSLFEALEGGTKVATVPEWREGRNNVAAANEHLLQLVAQRTAELVAENDKPSRILAWLQDAERDTGYLADRFEADPIGTDHRHVAVWRSAFESFLRHQDL